MKVGSAARWLMAVVLTIGVFGCERRAVREPEPQAASTAASVAEVEAVLERQKDAWNRGDIVAFMDAYVHDDTLVFTSGGKVRRGWNATLERYRARYADAGAMGKLTFWELETRVLSDDVAVVLGRWRLDDTPEHGEGVFSLVFVRDRSNHGRTWKILHDHTSVLVRDDEATNAAQ